MPISNQCMKVIINKFNILDDGRIYVEFKNICNKNKKVFIIGDFIPFDSEKESMELIELVWNKVVDRVKNWFITVKDLNPYEGQTFTFPIIPLESDDIQDDIIP